MTESESGLLSEYLRMFFYTFVLLPISGIGYLTGMFFIPPQINVLVGLICGLLLLRIFSGDNVLSLRRVITINIMVGSFFPAAFFHIAYFISGGAKLLRPALRIIFRGRRTRQATIYAGQAGYLILFKPEDGVFPPIFYFFIDSAFEFQVLLSMEIFTYYLLTSTPTIIIGYLMYR